MSAQPIAQPIQPRMANTERLSVTEKVGYGLGDTAANFVFQAIIVFQMAFYTDTFGLSAAAVGTLLLVVRISDAITDPLMGIIADRTNTRWGKFRPYVLFSAVPFGIMAYLTFTTPDLGPTGKLIYAYVTYSLLMAVYTVNNLPYSALSGVMTGDVAERTSLSQYRFVFAMLAAFMIQGLALPMVEHFGQGNDQRGYQLTMAVFSSLAVIFFIVTFLTTKERIRPAPGQQTSIRQDLRDLTRNGPWIAMFFATIVLFVTLALRGGVMLYYFRYFVGRENLFSLFNVLGLAATILGIVLSKPLAVRYGKRNVFIAGLFVTALLTAVFVLFPRGAITVIFAAEALRQFAYGFTIPLLWAMMADVADFSEWTNRRRATGIVFSGIVFALKAGLGFGGAIGGYLLAMYGYVANVEQTERALDGIRYMASVFPAVLFAATGALLFFYRIDRALELQISDDLAARRREYEAVDPFPVAP